MVLLVNPISSANSSDVYAGFSISKETTFFSVLFKPTFSFLILSKTSLSN